MRVLILEDEPSMAVLLEQLVKQLWPRAVVDLESDALSALDRWQRSGADLALLDWELPGMSGIEVLKQIKKSGSRTLCVMVSGHADRASILTAGAQHVDAFIVKPFDIDEVRARLLQVMAASPPEPEPDAPTVMPTFASLEAFVLFNLTHGLPGLPIESGFVQALKGIRQLDVEGLRALLQRSQCDPALVLRVLSLANGHGYARGPEPLETFESALRRIGLTGLVNLAVELSLLPGSALKHDWLRAQYQAFQRDSLALAEIVKQLGADVEFDVEAARTACLLYRVGELALLQVMQAWIDLGQTLDETQGARLLTREGARAGNQIKSQWTLPGSVRARVDAAHLLPEGTVRKEQVLMRIAGLIHSGESDQELMRLLARLGLPDTTVERYRVAGES
ncbi:response regulator [Allochromatium vinosum]|uniref:response regulator n=1 Tax=Allochromatium vinosum TaxID=1049 RepID=UPI0019055020|nr:response regulator [Allochromatium vinosum]MBK1655755.1 response regulator [Allochromatium vinosum]